MKREKDAGYWIRVALWATSIVIVAIPLKSLKQTHGSLTYLLVGLGVIFSFFLFGILISRWLNKRQQS